MQHVHMYAYYYIYYVHLEFDDVLTLTIAKFIPMFSTRHLTIYKIANSHVCVYIV